MMKALVIAALVFSGSMASAMTCQDRWGNKATVTFHDNGVSISSARYGRTGFLRANGESSSSYYFRNGFGGTAIVAKSVVNSGSGTVTYTLERHDEPTKSVRFYCN